jgi:prepilin signal peptidase PulO-like enzyme (type II secretory pathway)
MMIYIERHEAIALTFIWMLLMYSITHLFPGFIGRGDVKLIAALILVNELFSYIEPVRFLLLLLLVSSLIGLPGALIARKRGRTFPFAPALSVASWSIFFVPALAQIGNM